jgi:hypothetical protein
MSPNRLRTWRDWYHEFIRSGVFSLLPLPRTQAERDLERPTAPPLPEDATRLNIEGERRD